MSDKGPALIVVSARSRHVRQPQARADLLAAVIGAARTRGHEDVEVIESGGPSAVDAAVRGAVAKGVTLVVAIGGDGLVREVASPLSGTGVALGIVPGGTGNLLASALRVPRSAPAAVRLLTTARARPIDHGVASWAAGPGGAAGSGGFFVACGAGLDARLVGGATAEAKRRFGIAAYMGAALATAGDLRPRATRLVIDGSVHETRTVVVLVANAGELIPGMLGPRLPVAPDDGLLDVFVLHGGVVGSLHGALELLAAGGPGVGRAGLRLLGREVRVEVEPPEPIQLDGDVLGASPLEVRVVAGGLSVLGGPLA